MVTWGLGIEHEFNLKYMNKKIIKDKAYDVYLNSELIYKLYLFNEINFYQKYKSYIQNKSYYNDYIKNIEKVIEIRSMAITKKKFPFEKKEFFEIEKINDTYNLTEQTNYNLRTYLTYFIIYHIPILHYTYYIENNTLNENSILNFIEKTSTNKEDLIKNNYKLFNELYNNLDFNNKKQEIINTYVNKNIKLDRIKNLNILNFETIANTSTSTSTSTCTSTSTIASTSTSTSTRTSAKNNRNVKNKSKLTNKEDLNKIVNKQIKLLKDYIFNSIDFNQNIIENIFFCYKNDIPMLDSSQDSWVLEIMTIDFKNKNFETSYTNFLKYENSFIDYMNTIFNHYNTKKNQVIINSIGSRKEALQIIDIFNLNQEYLCYRKLLTHDYIGSYHLWITMPYNKDVSKNKFLNMHANLANKLQLLEPLISSNFSSPSYQIKNNKNFPSKLSLRHLLNAYSNYGTTDVSLMNNGSEFTYVKNIFFDKKNNPSIKLILPSKKNIYNINGSLIKNYNVLNDRKLTNNLYEFITEKINNSKNIKVKSFYELLFKNNPRFFKEFQKIFVEKENNEFKPSSITLGADIRTRDNNYLMYPINSDLKKIYYPLNNKYIEYYLDPNGKLLKKRNYDKEKYNKFLTDERVGFEFRVLDHFPAIYLDMILSLLPYLIIDSYEPKTIKNIQDTYISEQFWHNEMYQVIDEGYKHQFSISYLQKINKEFNINIKSRKYHSHVLLEELYDNLKLKFSKSKKRQILLKKINFEKKPLFFNFTEYATKFIESNN